MNCQVSFPEHLTVEWDYELSSLIPRTFDSGMRLWAVKSHSQNIWQWNEIMNCQVSFPEHLTVEWDYELSSLVPRTFDSGTRLWAVKSRSQNIWQWNEVMSCQISFPEHLTVERDYELSSLVLRTFDNGMNTYEPLGLFSRSNHIIMHRGAMIIFQTSSCTLVLYPWRNPDSF